MVCGCHPLWRESYQDDSPINSQAQAIKSLFKKTLNPGQTAFYELTNVIFSKYIILNFEKRQMFSVFCFCPSGVVYVILGYAEYTH